MGNLSWAMKFYGLLEFTMQEELFETEHDF